MAIATVGTTTTAEANGTTGLTNNVPTGVVDGNLLVWRWSGAGNASVPTTPTGWTVLQTGTTTVNGMAVWYRIAASEPASYTLGTLAASMRTTGTMSAYSGVDTGTPWDVATPAFVAGTTATTCPAITPTTAGAWVLGFGDANVASGVTNTTFSSSNLTAIDGQVSSTQGAATNNVGAIGHFVWSSGAFTPAWTTSNASVRTLGGSAALRPAATAAASFVANAVRPFRRPLLPRSGSVADRLPSQVAVTTPPAYAPDTRRRVVRGFASRRRRPAAVIPAQIVVAPPPLVPDTRRRAARGFVARRRRPVEVVPAQIVVAAPSYVSEARRAARRFVATRRGGQVGVIPPQIPAPDRNRRRGLRGWVAVRDRSRVEVVPPQVVVAPPTYVPTVPAKHNLRGMQRRGRHVVVVPPQQAAPTPPPYVPAMPPRHALRGVPRRGRRADVPLAQTPAHRGQPRRPIRVLGRKVRRAARVVGALIGPSTPLVPEVILYATVYDHTLTASTLTRTQTAATQPHTLSSTTRANTLTASTLDRTIEET